MDTVKIDGVEYRSKPDPFNNSCDECVGWKDELLCNSIGKIVGECIENKVFWVRKENIQKQVEMNRFFGKSMTEQIEMFPETLAVTQEEEEAWQTAQKAVATGVTDGTLSPTEYIKAIGTDPLSVQVGGGHYKSMAIQPVEYITKNNLPYCEANVIKYISRWREKGGKKDLEKAKHYIDLLIQLENL